MYAIVRMSKTEILENSDPSTMKSLILNRTFNMDLKTSLKMVKVRIFLNFL